MRAKREELFPILEQAISEYIDKNGTAPTVAEIADAVGVSKPTASRYLSYMREHGMIDYSSGHRSIVTKEAKKTRTESTSVPVLGAVSCGTPKFAEENIEEYVRLPVALIGKGEFFLLRANGDSMIEAGIDNGDLVLVRRQNYADEGQIVVALMEDEATLKRFYPEPEHRRIRLHPENSKMEDILVPDCIIQGVAVKVLKDLI